MPFFCLHLYINQTTPEKIEKRTAINLIHRVDRKHLNPANLFHFVKSCQSSLFSPLSFGGAEFGGDTSVALF